MSKTFFTVLIISVLAIIPIQTNQPQQEQQQQQPQLAASAGALPLNFEANQGQTNERVKFLARSQGYVFFLTANEAVMALENPATHRKGKENRDPADRSNDFEAIEKHGRPPRAIVRMKLQGANPSPQIEGIDPSVTTSNYFAGANPSDWRTNVANYARVRYAEVYPGIDMVYFGNQRRLEYDFIVAPGSNPESIKLAFRGIQGFEITPTCFRVNPLLIRKSRA